MAPAPMKRILSGMGISLGPRQDTTRREYDQSEWHDVAGGVLADVQHASHDDLRFGQVVVDDVLLNAERTTSWKEIVPRLSQLGMTSKAVDTPLEQRAIAPALFDSPLSAGVEEDRAQVSPGTRMETTLTGRHRAPAVRPADTPLRLPVLVRPTTRGSIPPGRHSRSLPVPTRGV